MPKLFFKDGRERFSGKINNTNNFEGYSMNKGLSFSGQNLMPADTTNISKRDE
jgi:hypothetical protein